MTELHDCYVTERDKQYAPYLEHYCHDPSCPSYCVSAERHSCHDVMCQERHLHRVSVLGATQNAIDGGKIRTFEEIEEALRSAVWGPVKVAHLGIRNLCWEPETGLDSVKLQKELQQDPQL